MSASALKMWKAPKPIAEVKRNLFFFPSHFLPLAASFQNYSVFRLDPCKSFSNRDREGGHISYAPEKNNLTFLKISIELLPETGS